MATVQPILKTAQLDAETGTVDQINQVTFGNKGSPFPQPATASSGSSLGPESILSPCDRDRVPVLSVMANSHNGRRVFAFLPSSPDWAHLSLKNDCGVINVLMPDWYRVNNAAPLLEVKFDDPDVRESVNTLLDSETTQLEILPVIELSSKTDKRGFIGQLAKAEYRDALIGNIRKTALSARAGGMCISLVGFKPQDLNNVKLFVAELRQNFSDSPLSVCVVSETADIFKNAPDFLASIDYAVVKLFDEPWVGSQPAPLAAQDWFQKQAEKAVQLIGPEKLIVAIGNLAADWTSNRPVPEMISYSEAVTRITRANAQINFSATALNSFSAFVDKNGLRHQIWLLDAVSAYNQAEALRELGVSNVAIWPLGFEDPTLWRVLNSYAGGTAELVQSLSDIQIENYVSYRGEGAFMRYISEARPGVRHVTLDSEKHLIKNQNYLEIPKATSIERYGRASPNQIALTFDDGPHPSYTKAILDTLKRTNTPATFFLVGKNVLKSPELVQRMVAEGHEIGSHTFWHPRMDKISHSRSIIELNSVQKLINETTGHGVVLYREPFLRGDGPITNQRAKPMRLLQSLDYIVAGSDIVPPDWAGSSSDEIVAYVMDKVRSGAGGVIVLHDAGNDRSETVAAVPVIIESLRQEGYEIVSLSEMLGMEKLALMPKVSPSDDIISSVSFTVVANTWDFLTYVFWVVIVVGAVRSLAVLTMAFIRRPHRTFGYKLEPSVTVIIPAFNEEVVVNDCIESVLASDYHNLKAIVIDDGSGDETLEAVLRKYGEHPNVQFICQQNQGKWRALNAAYGVVDTEIVVSIDADTRIGPDTVSKLARHFNDPKIGAVAGKVTVDNRVSLLTRLQSLEYTTSQNIDRLAADLINGILVVPGAIGAWRVSAVRAAGLYSGATQTEDADLTMAVIRQGYKVIYEESAVAATEVPSSINSLLKQRLRWSLGMLQGSWKHRGAICKGSGLGWVALPDLVIYGYLLPILAPIADLYFFTLIFNTLASAYSSGEFVVSAPNQTLLFAYMVLPLLDVVTLVAALRMDRSESYWMLLLIPFQRFFYRQLLYFSVLRALLVALTGRPSRWGKLERTGFVSSKGA